MVGDVKCELTMLTALLSLALAAADFAGAVQCAPCHRAQYDKQRLSHHAGSLAPILKSALPRKLAGHTVRESNGLAFTYAMSPNGISVSVARGGEQSSATLEWAFGAGVQGITPVGRIGSRYFEHRVSWYPREGRAGLTIGHHAAAPDPIAEALGHLQSAETIYRCFNCHATGVQTGPDLSGMRPGIECERCHGPGAIHVEQRTLDVMVGGPSEESSDASIVNPGKLPPEIRDDVCAQCHLAGDARVLQPGKDYLDFRPGTALGDVVAIFSVPQTIKGSHFVALDQFEQVKMSRCWTVSKGKMGCISCHDPHIQLQGEQAADFFRTRCLSCHAPGSCREPLAQRQATSPPDNCVQCHMPKHPNENIGHSSNTDHRILRAQSEIPAAPEGNASRSPTDLIDDTKPSSPGQTRMNLRTLALAYAQASGHYREFGEKGLALLEEAAAVFPADAEVQAAYGSVLRVARPREEQRASEALQKAIDDGSKSAEYYKTTDLLRCAPSSEPVFCTLKRQRL